MSTQTPRKAHPETIIGATPKAIEDFQISPHFSFLELTTTNHRRFLDANRQMSPALLNAGKVLAGTILEPIRARFGRPVVIHSGYRCPQLNRAIGGAASSQHTKFEAADFHVVGVPLVEVFDWIRSESGIKFGQLILEGWAVGNPTWIHISLGAPFRPASKSGQVLTMVAGKYSVVK